ncbi:MAG: G5 domain-containing protein [Oscillospiraceae bacterium]|jgi:3D (Asp-Asp-Asp) domain-containing protein|nr:G5 domain-containing protein [Oscillospiraceae bacterium]
MRFRLEQLRQASQRAGTWCALFARRLRHAVTRRLVLAPLFLIISLALYARYVTEFNLFLIIDQNEFTVHRTYAKNAGEALAETGIYVNQHDSVMLNASEISILRATHAFVTLDGTTVPVNCYQGGTVMDALAKAGYIRKEHDLLSHNPAAPVTEGMEITVTRIEFRSGYEYEEIPYEEVVNENPYINYGTSVVITEGEPGLREITYNETLRDGVVIARRPAVERIAKKPVTKVTELGTGNTIKQADGTYLFYKKRLEVECTAYTTERQVNKINAIGKIARKGTIAVDPKVIPLRSKVYVAARNGAWVYGVAVCEDTGGSIKGNIIDLYFDTYDECIQFGRRKAYLYILE